MLTSSEPPPPSTPALVLRNRLLAALVSPPDAAAQETFLARCDDDSALVFSAAEQVPVVILTAALDAEGQVLDRLSRRLGSVLKEQPPGVIHLVIVGGGREVYDVIAEAAKGAHELRSLGLHHLDDAGALARVAGRRLGALERAADALPSAKPFDAEQIRAAIAATKTGHVEAVRFSTALRGRFPLVSTIIGVTCLALFALAKRWDQGEWGLTLLRMGANQGLLVRAGQVFRLLSSAFLHANETHLIVNLMSLYFVGVFLEQVLGRARFLVVYGLAAAGGGVASALLGGGLSVGASGALWGLMTAGFGLALRPRGVLPPVVAGRLRQSMTLPLVANLAFSFVPGIDKWAHFGGGAVGLVLVLSGLVTRGNAPAEGDRIKLPPAPTWMVALAWLVGVATAASIALALLAGQPWEHWDVDALRRAAPGGEVL